MLVLGFGIGANTAIYLPTNQFGWDAIYQRTYHVFDCFGRLKDGVGIAQAQAELEVVHNGLIDRYPETDKGYGIRLTPLLDDVVSGYSGTVWLLGAAVAVLLLIAAANVASLLFVHGLERRRELAIAFWDAVLAKVRQLPGVSEVAMNDSLPLNHEWEVLTQFTVDGEPDPGPGHHPILDWQMISPNYFRTLEIPLLEGRDFDLHDKIDGQQVVIIDDDLADHYFAGQNPIGKVINYESSEGLRHCTVVGVVPHVRYRSPGIQENQFQAYFPYSQWGYDAEILVMRCQGDPNAQTAAVRKAVQSVDPNVPVPNIRTYDDLIAQTRRFLA